MFAPIQYCALYNTSQYWYRTSDWIVLDTNITVPAAAQMIITTAIVVTPLGTIGVDG
jgi:hypothetical protein